jgi:hypothetical protein
MAIPGPASLGGGSRGLEATRWHQRFGGHAVALESTSLGGKSGGLETTQWHRNLLRWEADPEVGRPCDSTEARLVGRRIWRSSVVAFDRSTHEH